MSQFCPVCRSRLWNDPIFTPSRLRCPRCGAEFKPTVPWIYFRVLLLVVIALSLLVIVLLTRGNLWLLAFFLGLAIFLWFLPRIINLQHIGPELTPSEGVLDPRQLELKLEDLSLEQKLEEAEEERDFRKLIYLLLTALALILVVIVLWTEADL